MTGVQTCALPIYARTNAENLIKLKQDIRGGGYGYIPLEGVGQEQDEEGNVKEVKEPSFLVIGNSDGRLRHDVLEWGKKYNQFAVIYYDPKTGTELLRSDGQVLDRFDKFTPRVATFFSRHRGKSFHFEGVKYGDPPHSIIEGMGRFGEVLWQYRDGDDWRSKVLKDEVSA